MYPCLLDVPPRRLRARHLRPSDFAHRWSCPSRFGDGFRNIAGALKPGGRLVFACWAPLAENRHWLISQTSHGTIWDHRTPAHEPGPLAFGDAHYIRGVLTAAVFAEINVERAHPTIICDTPRRKRAKR
jgi:hypothetical protein